MVTVSPGWCERTALPSAAVLFTFVPSTAVITSPCCRPACAAGLPLCTAWTATPCPLLVAATSTPRNAELVVGVWLVPPLPLPFPFPLLFPPLLLPFPLRGFNGNVLLPLPLPVPLRPSWPNRSRSACCRP